MLHFQSISLKNILKSVPWASSNSQRDQRPKETCSSSSWPGSWNVKCHPQAHVIEYLLPICSGRLWDLRR